MGHLVGVIDDVASTVEVVLVEIARLNCVVVSDNEDLQGFQEMS